MEIKYTPSGYIYISSDDDCQETVDAMLAVNYSEDFCIAEDFCPKFVAKLMKAGFLVMSIDITNDTCETDNNMYLSAPYYILLPKLHLVRSALFYENLHIKKSIRRFFKSNANLYKLEANIDFDIIIDHCVEKHGSDWLTPPLVDCIKKIRNSSPDTDLQPLTPKPYPYPASFALYRDKKLVAGEFGIVCGKVYTSYSGFYEEANAGTVQIILTTQYLQKQGFSFFDLGMPLKYKSDLGAVDISPEEFVFLFRKACSE